MLQDSHRTFMMEKKKKGIQDMVMEMFFCHNRQYIAKATSVI